MSLKIKNGFILIDTGLPVHWKRLKKELVMEDITKDKLKLVIITHGDIDHIGNSLKLQKEYNAKIAIHKSDYEIVKSGMYPKREIKGTIYKIILSAGDLDRKLKKNKDYFKEFKPDIFLFDGQSLEEYGFNARVIHIPGHTKGSIGILTNEGELFVGDAVINRKIPQITTIIENHKEFKNSIEKLKNLDIKMVYPGHGNAFSGKIIKELN